MNRRDACAVLAATLAGAACAPNGNPARRSLLISGADAMLPLVRALAQAFLRERRAGLPGGSPALDVIVERGGSVPAYIAASRRAIDVAAMTRALSDAEDGPGARQHLIARDDIGIVVHRALPLADLARAQVRGLLTGEIANWRALGGPDLPVTVYAHPRGAPARQSTEQLLLEGADFSPEARELAGEAALAAVAATPGAIGYLAGHARGGREPVALLAVDGVPPTAATVLSGRYPYTHGFHLLLHGEPGGEREAFVRFARGAAGQALVAGFGLVAVC
ncbi:substrate-binding domain-containing protein [Burkholderia sp. LMU1-1-1.1]|uniref:substrate-binding domain-containing protein n=1 Tax=Burkholderia sp. LMU1-1-1.1 TaxID=3135266 RepID=UPI0034213D1A